MMNTRSSGWTALVSLAFLSGAAQSTASERHVTEFIQGREFKAMVHAMPWGFWHDRLTATELERARAIFPRKSGPFPEMADTFRIDHLFSDIRESSYVVREECRDHLGAARMATSVLNDRGGEICFDAGLIAEHQIALSELMGLALHEHAHHFGDPDEDHLWVAMANRIYGRLLSGHQYSYHSGPEPRGIVRNANLRMGLNQRPDHPFFRGDVFGALERGDVANGFFPNGTLGFYRWQAGRGGTDRTFEVNVFGGTLRHALIHALLSLQNAAEWYRFFPRTEGSLGPVRVHRIERSLVGHISEELVVGGNEFPLYVARSIEFEFVAESGAVSRVTIRNPEFGQESVGPVSEIR